jgi:hypothetical protein
MKLALMLLVAGSCAWAQHGGAGGGHAGGGGHSGPSRGSRSSRGGQRYLAPPPVSHGGHGRGAIVPYPVFYGSYYFCDPAYCGPTGSGDENAPAPADNYSDDSGAYGAPGEPPVVLVNPNYQPETAHGVMHDYSNANLPPPGPAANAKPDDQPTIYLIAMTDHTILAAIAYWVDGDTLDYITQDGDQNRVSLALVDREFSRKLNSDRAVEFRLPAAK